jgi:hypothetical protein
MAAAPGRVNVGRQQGDLAGAVVKGSSAALFVNGSGTTINGRDQKIPGEIQRKVGSSRKLTSTTNSHGEQCISDAEMNKIFRHRTFSMMAPDFNTLRYRNLTFIHRRPYWCLIQQ